MRASDIAAQIAELVKTCAAPDAEAVSATDAARQIRVTRLSRDARKLIGVGIQSEVFKIRTPIRVADCAHGVGGDGLGLDLVDAGRSVEFIGGRVAFVEEVKRDAQPIALVHEVATYLEATAEAEWNRIQPIDSEVGLNDDNGAVLG